MFSAIGTRRNIIRTYRPEGDKWDSRVKYRICSNTERYWVIISCHGAIWIGRMDSG